MQKPPTLVQRLAEMFDFAPLRKSVAGLTERLANIAVDITAAENARSAVINAPANREDLKAMVSAWVTAQADAFDSNVASTFGQFISQPSLISRSPRADVMSLINPADPYSRTVNASDLNRALCALFPAQVLATLHASVDAAKWPGEGLPMSERAAATAGFEAKLNELRTEEAALREQAAALGIYQI